jgi:hypothetical protein
MPKITSENNPSARGRQRMAELGAEHAHAIAVNSAAMLAGLRDRFGREPTQAEVFLAEGICSLFYQAAKKRERGHSDLELLREAAIMTNNSVFRSPHAVAPTTEQQS